MKAMLVLAIAVLVLPWARSAHADNPKPDKLASEEWFVLMIRGDGSLMLDGMTIARKDLGKEAARLAERVRKKAKAEGQVIDPKIGLPAGINIWADNETPYSLIAPLMIECQDHGFRRWAFTMKWADPDLPAKGHDPTTTTPSKEKNQHSDVIRTIPIRLRGDDRGTIDRVTLGERELRDFQALRFELSMIQDDPDSPFDRALLKVDSTLMISELVRVTDLLARYRITEINFMEMGPADSP